MLSECNGFRSLLGSEVGVRGGDFTVSFIGKTLMAVESARDLGVYIDLHLTYDTHISHLVSSCLTKLVQINRVKYCFDRKTLVLIITSLVFSKMLYCSTVWSNTSSKNIQKLQLIQNFACKIICGARKYDHVTPLLDELNWLPVSKMLKMLSLKNDLLYIIAQPVIMRSSKSHYSGQPLANVPSPIEQYPCGTR